MMGKIREHWRALWAGARDRERNERGFRVFVERKDFEVGALRISESSLAFEGAHVRISAGKPINNNGDQGHIHCNVAQAKAIIAGLDTFIREAEADELTEPARPQEEDS